MHDLPRIHARAQTFPEGYIQLGASGGFEYCEDDAFLDVTESNEKLHPVANFKL